LKGSAVLHGLKNPVILSKKSCALVRRSFSEGGISV